MSRDFLGRKDPNGIATDSAYLASPSKSAEEAAREPYIDEDHLYRKYESMKMANERNMKEKHEAQAALAWQREREAELEIKISCLEKALMIRDEREALLVEALEFYAKNSSYVYRDHPDGLDGRGDFPVMKDDGHKARAALLKYRGGEQIKKETCKHEPVQIWTGAYEDDLNPKIKFRCRHCGVELQATWGEK
jgi:hypothetical protein